MGIATLILGYVQALVWPLVVLTSVLLFRTQLRTILWRLQRADLPGGVSLNFQQEVEAASALARRAAQQVGRVPLALSGRTGHALLDVNERTLALGLQPSPSALNFATYRALAAHDPNVALAGLRIELEILLRNMARRFNPDPPAVALATDTLHDLRDSGVLSDDQARLIQRIVNLCTAAVHGAIVAHEQAEMILDAATVIRDAYLRWLMWEADAEPHPV
jgi:hypothetical protein